MQRGRGSFPDIQRGLTKCRLETCRVPFFELIGCSPSGYPFPPGSRIRRHGRPENPPLRPTDKPEYESCLPAASVRPALVPGKKESFEWRAEPGERGRRVTGLVFLTCLAVLSKQ